MGRKKTLFFLLLAMPFGAAFAGENFEHAEKFLSNSVLPSEITLAGFTGFADGSDDGDAMSGPMRGPGGNPNEPPSAPVGSGLGLLTLCAGFYLMKSKRHLHISKFAH